MGVLSAISARRALIAESIRTRLWPVPAAAVIAAAALGVASTQLDRAIDQSLPASVSYFLFGGGPDAAREVLGAIASSLITVTSLTFSLTLVTLQLASSQFSPRLLRTFAGDRFVQRTLALFLATFIYALTVLRTVYNGTNGGPGFVPKMSVTLAYLLAAVSVVVLVLFLAHLVREIRVERMLHNVVCDGLATVDGMLSRRPPGDIQSLVRPADARLVIAAASGFVVSVDEESLLDIAGEHEAVVAIDRSPGEWVVKGTPIGAVWPAATDRTLPSPELNDRIAACVYTGSERTPVQDVGYGLRQLTDVANKALSPGINDPTTAVHALGQSSTLLCAMAGHDVGPVVLSDEHGVARVVLQRPEWPALLDLAVAQPCHYGAADAAVQQRLFALLRDTAWCIDKATDMRAVELQLARLRDSAARQHFDAIERADIERAGASVEAALRGEWV
jgi:uncharacterized membrane protein